MAKNTKGPMKIQFGKIASYDSRSETGTVEVVGEPVHAHFSTSTLRNIFAGHSEPEFRPIDRFDVLTLDNIEIGDEVAVNVNVYYNWESVPNKRTLRRTVEVTNWTHAVSYYDAWRIIRARPIFEVVEYVLYNGTPTTGEQRRVVDRGTAIELQAKYPRGTAGDPLAPEKQLLGFTCVRRWHQKSNSQQFPDPRPIPAGQKAEPFRPTNEHGMLLATGPDIAFALGRKTSFARKLTMVS